MRRLLVLFLCASAPCACGPVTPKNVERFVLIGDNVASNPTLGTGYAALFEKNDDALFPEFAGKDLRSRIARLRKEGVVG